jgi:predicted RNase H-like HicB family nuclease
MPNNGARAPWSRPAGRNAPGDRARPRAMPWPSLAAEARAVRERIVARIRRDKDGSWLVTFPDIRGAHTYGRSLNQLRRRIPELLRLWDRDPTQFDVVEVLDLPNNLRQAISVATKQRLELEQQSQAVQRDMERTIRLLQSQLRLGVRDSGELLGISPQYAHKLRHRTAAGRTSSVRKSVSNRLPR